LLVIVTTLAISGLWHLVEWLLDIYFGTSYLLGGISPDAINDAVMHQFIYATISGVAAGALFGWHFRSSNNTDLVEVPTHFSVETDDYVTHRPPAPIRKLLGISDKTQVLAARILQGGLVATVWNLKKGLIHHSECNNRTYPHFCTSYNHTQI
jgi:hypothetical protein